MNQKKVILYLIFNITYFNSDIFALPIFGNGGYEDKISTYEDLVKNLQKPIVDINLAQSNLNRVKDILNEIESNAKTEITILTPLRSFLASKDFYPEEYIYFEDEDNKKDAIDYLTKKIAEKKLLIDKIAKDIDQVKLTKPKQPVVKELTLLEKLNNLKKSKFYNSEYEGIIANIKSLLPTNDKYSLDLFNNFIKLLSEDPKSNQFALKYKILKNQLDNLVNEQNEEEEWE